MKAINISVILEINDDADIDKMMSEMKCTFEHDDVLRSVVTHYNEAEKRWTGQYEEKDSPIIN